MTPALNRLTKKNIFYLIVIVTVAIVSLYSFYHKGLKVPFRTAYNIKETERRAGDFWSTFPASFVEKYNPELRAKTIVKGWYKDPEWGYGPIQHLITLPLTFISSIKIVSVSWLFINYLFLALAIFLFLKTITNLPIFYKSIVVFMWLAYWPLYPAIEENVVEVFELFMIVLSLFLLYRRRDVFAGVAMGIASMAKFLPLLFLLYFFIKGKFKSFTAMFVTILIILTITQFTLGWQNSFMIKQFLTEIKEDKYDYTYWRSQTLPSAIERIFSTTDYSSVKIYYPQLTRPVIARRLIKITISLIFLFIFILLYKRRFLGDIRMEYGLISIVMFLTATHGEHYYLIFALIGYSMALYKIYQKKYYFGGLILFISYFIAGYLVQVREFDKILLPDYTNINREIFFHFLSFPTYGIVLLFILLIIIYYKDKCISIKQSRER